MTLIGIFGAILIGLLTDELLCWTPLLSVWLVRQSSARLPAEIRERYLEEWHAHLNDTPGRLSKVACALGTWLAVVTVRWGASPVRHRLIILRLSASLVASAMRLDAAQARKMKLLRQLPESYPVPVGWKKELPSVSPEARRLLGVLVREMFRRHKR
jgi:hypothetical protein